MNKRYMVVIAGLLLFACGGAAGYAAGFRYEHQNLVRALSGIHPIRDKNPNYAFIDPLLAYVIPSADQDDEFSLIKEKLSVFIDDKRKAGGITNASLFLYDLNRGRWIGVNEDEAYAPASMLKVVIMVAYLKEAETNPDILQKKLTYTAPLQELLKGNPYNSPSSLQVGKSYTVDTLINNMIIDSDNGAEFLLLDHVNGESLDYIYHALNIKSPETSQEDFAISPRSYSLFFRILYSATYLSRDMSERALKTLSKTTFADGITGVLPEGTTVSHKFGQYMAVNRPMELHDCGVIYTGNNPYFLCVMTHGTMLDELKNVIQGISAIVYENYSAD